MYSNLNTASLACPAVAATTAEQRYQRTISYSTNMMCLVSGIIHTVHTGTAPCETKSSRVVDVVQMKRAFLKYTGSGKSAAFRRVHRRRHRRFDGGIE